MSKYQITGYITIPRAGPTNIRPSAWANEACPMLIDVFAQLGLVKDDVELAERERNDCPPSGR
jgi:hypothetical protein